MQKEAGKPSAAQTLGRRPIGLQLRVREEKIQEGTPEKDPGSKTDIDTNRNKGGPYGWGRGGEIEIKKKSIVS